jgi:hypothetical protein
MVYFAIYSYKNNTNLKKGISMKRIIITATALVLLQGCLATEQEIAEMNSNKAEVDKVRVVPASMVANCTFIKQTSIVKGQSFFGGSAALASDAETTLKKEAFNSGANTIHITDRMLDDGNGGKKQPSMTLFGDFYQC